MIEFSLLFISIILFLLMAPLGLLTRIILIFVKDSREQFTKITDYPFAIAHTIDILGNIVCADLFNITLIKHSGSYKFGVKTETISSVLGKNIKTKTLTRTGRLLASLLDRIDSHHCIKSIQNI